MEIIEAALEGCYIIKNTVFGDDRGFFLESFHQQKLADLGIQMDVQQVNFARSDRHVLRGLHYQKEPFAQAKLVGVITGAVRDVAVDMRKDSPTFGKSLQYELSTPDTLLYIPKGFAHGYLTLADQTTFYYVVDNIYAPDHECGLFYDDPSLQIDWGDKEKFKVSEKDRQQPLISQAYTF